MMLLSGLSVRFFPTVELVFPIREIQVQLHRRQISTCPPAPNSICTQNNRKQSAWHGQTDTKCHAPSAQL